MPRGIEVTSTRRVNQRRRGSGRVATGEYRRHRVGLLGLSACRGCRACGYDGWIKVGDKRKGRRAGRPAAPSRSKRGPKGAMRRGLWRVGWGGAFIAMGEARFGTIGSIVVGVFVVVWLALTTVAWVAKVGAR